MTDIKWGPAIAVDGKRPGFVGDTDMVLGHEKDGSPFSRPYPAGHIYWTEQTNIALPADHPHYRQTEEAPIDWSGELEAVHEDGRVVRVKLAPISQPDGDGDFKLTEGLEHRGTQARYFKRDGTQRFQLADVYGGGRPWRIRNVPQPTPQADTKPDLTARMEALVRDLAGNELLNGRYASEARAIVALLPEPVDPDLIECRRVMAQRYPDSADRILAGAWDHNAVGDSMACVAACRALALAGEKEA